MKVLMIIGFLVLAGCAGQVYEGGMLPPQVEDDQGERDQEIDEPYPGYFEEAGDDYDPDYDDEKFMREHLERWIAAETCEDYGVGSREFVNCILMEAREQKDWMRCRDLPFEEYLNEREGCYTEVALALMDESVCEHIDPEYKEDYQLESAIEYCKMSVKVNRRTTDVPPQSKLEECRGYEEQDNALVAGCYVHAALEEDDHTICEYIVDSTLDPIHFQCIVAVAQSRNDPSLCRNIKSSGAGRELAMQQCEMIAGR